MAPGAAEVAGAEEEAVDEVEAEGVGVGREARDGGSRGRGEDAGRIERYLLANDVKLPPFDWPSIV